VTVSVWANRKAVKISHTVVLLKPVSTCAPGNVPVSASTVIATTTETAMGTGWAAREIMVVTKTASKWRCCPLRPGAGRKYSNTPGISAAQRRPMLRRVMGKLEHNTQPMESCQWSWSGAP
jgi:hypothetical protein